MRSRMLMLLGLGMGAVAGCCTPTGYRSAYVARPLPPAPCDRCAGSATILPPRYTGAPADPGGLAPTAALSPPTLPNAQSAFAPPVPGDPPVAGDPPFSRFNPDGNSRLYPPLPTNPAPVEPPTARLLPPQSIPAPAFRDPVPAPRDPGPVTKETEEPPILPADIPQFATVKKGVASGQQPFPDGVKWLKDHGYKTVLHVRAPTESDNAAKRIFENRGLTYLSLEVGPHSLTKDVVERFNQIVTDEKNLPLFVFDKNSSLTGALWYLHFRTVDGMSDEKARAEATRLGFRQEQDDNHRDMWIAVQAYLKSQNP